MDKIICTDDHLDVRAADASYGPEVWDFGTSNITKSASDAISRKMIAEHRPPPTHIGVHAITMGAEEDYGCLARDTPLLKPDGSHTNFHDVRVGDEVVSGAGFARKVTHIFEYDLETAIKFTVGGLAKNLIASPDHPFRVADFEQFVCERDKWRRCLPGNRGQQNICRRAGGCPLAEGDYHVTPQHDYKQAQDIRARDYLVYRLPEFAPEELISEDEAMVIGYFLAEGSFQRNFSNKQVASLRFDFDLAERDTFAAELLTAAERCGFRAAVLGPYEGRPNEILVTVNGAPERFRQYAAWFGEGGAADKRIPTWFVGLPTNVKARLLESYLKGDAAITDPEQCSATTVSYDLACGIQRLLWSLGIAATAFYYEVAERPGNMGASAFQGYRINYAYTRVPEELPALRFGHRTDKMEVKVHLFIIGNEVFLPIRAVETIDWNDKVCTLEVEEDHSYVSAGVWSRNCNRNADSASRASLRKYHPTFMKYGCIYREHRNTDPETQGIGQIKIAAYNERENRGELFFWVEKDKAPDIVKKAKEGKELSWSMSMRLPFDRCSVCDNKARSRRQYCSDLTNYRLRLVPGRNKIAYARNEDDVKFYDLSEVEKRADRLATYLSYTFGDDEVRKAAALDDALVIGGAEWADFYTGDAPTITAFSTAERALVSKAAAALRAPHAFREELRALSPLDLDAATLQKLAGCNFTAVAGEMTKRAMILPFSSFAGLVLGCTAETAAGDPEIQKAACGLPGILEDMESDGGCACGESPETVVGPCGYGATYEGNKDIIDEMLSKAEKDSGLKPDDCAQRMLVLRVKTAAAATSNTTSELANGLAKLYAFYAVKSAAMIAQRGEISTDLTAQFLSILLDPK